MENLMVNEMDHLKGMLLEVLMVMMTVKQKASRLVRMMAKAKDSTTVVLLDLVREN
jgi:hypothetical protein